MYGKRKKKGYFIHPCDLKQKQRQNNKMVPTLPNSPESLSMSFQGQKVKKTIFNYSINIIWTYE